MLSHLSVAVLLKVYANCIDGEEEAVNDKIEHALATSRGQGRIGGKPRHLAADRTGKAQVRWVQRRRTGSPL
jgi:hypothetical protein